MDVPEQEAGDVALEAGLAARIDAAYDLIFAPQLDAAERLLADCLEQAETAGLRRQVIRSMYWLSYVSTLRGEHFLGEQRLESALNLAEEENNPALIAGIHASFARLHFMRGRMQDAELALERALARSHDSHDLRREAEAYGLLAACRRSLGHHEDAFEYLKAAAVLWRSLPSEEVALTETLLDLSHVAFELGLDSAAADAFAEASGIDSGPSHAHIMARGYLLQARQHLLLDDLAAVETLLQEAHRLAPGSGEFELTIESQIVRGGLALKTADLPSALEHLGNALRLAQNAQSRMAVAEIRLPLAQAQLSAGQLETALATLSDAEVAFEMFGARPRLAQAYCIWTHYRLAEGRTDAAAAALLRARQLADSIGQQLGRTLTADLHSAAQALDAAQASHK